MLAKISELPVSFEVFADDLDMMERQARVITTSVSNVNVKIPVMNTKGVFTGPVISSLSRDNIPLNVTAIMTVQQVADVAEALSLTRPRRTRC